MLPFTVMIQFNDAFLVSELKFEIFLKKDDFKCFVKENE